MPITAVVFDAYGTLFDVHSVIARCNAIFPARGTALSQAWRQKQLEYTWLRSLMGRYESFEIITEHALRLACAALGLVLSTANVRDLMQGYRALATYPEVADTLAGLRDCRLAILSNGSTGMLNALLKHAKLDRVLDHVLSVDEIRIFKPRPNVYRLAVEKLHSKPKTSASCHRINGMHVVPHRSAFKRSGSIAANPYPMSSASSRKRPWSGSPISLV